jgi:hypothetical protein
MTVIVFFKTSGIGSNNSGEATDYLLGPHSALTPSLKKQYELETSGIKFARNAGDFELAELLTTERDKIQGKLREPPAVSLSMNTKNVEYAISITPHKRKYASGVIAHADEDTKLLNEHLEIGQEFRELFEHLIFAGLPNAQWLIEWVQHTHEGNIENHFIIPRINLPTGKYFNPHYPGSEKDFNAVRDYLNLKYSLASPLEAKRRSQPIKINKYDPNKKMKQRMLSKIDSLMASDFVHNRLDIIHWLKSEKTKSQFNIEDVDVKPEFIRLKVTTSNSKIKTVKLKGALFRQDFTCLEALNVTNNKQPELSESEREKRLSELWGKITQAIEKRAEFNIKRYEVTNSNVLLPTKSVFQQGKHNDESYRTKTRRSDGKTASRSDSQTGETSKGINSTIIGSRKRISTANRDVARRPSFFSKLIEKLTTSINKFIDKRRRKRNRVEQQAEPIEHWVTEQPRLNAEIHQAYQGFEEQISKTSLNAEQRRISMEINVILFDYNKGKPKELGVENSIEASLGIK